MRDDDLIAGRQRNSPAPPSTLAIAGVPPAELAVITTPFVGSGESTTVRN